MTGPHITIPTEASPLSWPPTIKRTEKPRRSQFVNPTVARAVADIRDELRRLGARNIVISTNLPAQANGNPLSRPRSLSGIDDQGATVYWTLLTDGRDVPYCLPCDRWMTVAENLHAIGKTIKALRDVERWGAIRIEQAFEGFKALPPGSGAPPIVTVPEIDWRAVLGGDQPVWPELPNEDLLGLAKTRHRRLIQLIHPDMPGGDVQRAAELNAALDAAEKELTA